MEGNPFPIEVTLHGRKISVTVPDVLKFWRDGEELIKELNQDDTPRGQLATLIENDAEQANSIGGKLKRLTQIMAFREDDESAESLSLQDTLMGHIQTYLEHAPVLDNASVIKATLNKPPIFGLTSI